MTDHFEVSVWDVVTETLADAPPKPDRDYGLVADLGADSLDAIEIICGLEEVFGVEISEDRASEMMRGTFGELCDDLAEIMENQ